MSVQHCLEHQEYEMNQNKVSFFKEMAIWEWMDDFWLPLWPWLSAQICSHTMVGYSLGRIEIKKSLLSLSISLINPITELENPHFKYFLRLRKGGVFPELLSPLFTCCIWIREQLFSRLTVKEKALLQKNRAETRAPILQWLPWSCWSIWFQGNPGQDMEHRVSEHSISLAWWVMLPGLHHWTPWSPSCTAFSHRMLVQVLSLWYRPPRGHQQWEQGAEQPLGSMLWGIYHELGVDEVNKGSFCSHHPRNLAKMNYFLGKACTKQKTHTSFSDTKGNTVQAWGEGGALSPHPVDIRGS